MTVEDDDVLARYDADKPLHDALAPKLDALLRELLESHGVRTQSIEPRVKDRKSVERKLQRTPDQYGQLADMTDIVGVRIITYFPDQVDDVARIIEHEFVIDRDNSIDKRADLKPDQFGYLSLHYVARLSADRAALVEWKRFAECVFEIQLRSVLQHAWAEIEHDLGYKSETEVPRHIRRRFSQLAGLLEVADEMFVSIRKDLEAHSAEVQERVRTTTEGLLIDKDSMRAYIESSPTVHGLDASIADACNVTIGEMDGEVMDFLAALLSKYAIAAGFETLRQLDSWLQANRKALMAFARAILNGSEGSDKIPAVSVMLAAIFAIGVTRDRDRIKAFFEGITAGSSFGAPIDGILVAVEAVAAEMPLPPPPAAS